MWSKKGTAAKQCATYLIAMVDWLAVRDLMLFETMALIEPFEAVLALEFGLVRDVLVRLLTRLCLRFLRFGFAVLIELLMFPLFVLLQVLPAGVCVVAKAAVEQTLRGRSLFFDLHADSHHLSLIIGHEIHITTNCVCFAKKPIRPIRG